MIFDDILFKCLSCHTTQHKFVMVSLCSITLLLIFSQVDGYLHNEEEQRYKKIIWEEMNKEYLEVMSCTQVSFKKCYFLHVV